VALGRAAGLTWDGRGTGGRCAGRERTHSGGAVSRCRPRNGWLPGRLDLRYTRARHRTPGRVASHPARASLQH